MSAAFPVDWWALFWHFVAMSLMAIGGAITTAPEMHRYTVGEQHWLTDAQFNASVALAQAAPGPNVIFIAVLGWQIGVNSGQGYWGGALGVLCTMVGIMLPSTTLTFTVTRWLKHNTQRLSVQAFKSGLAPVVIALLVATAFLLVGAYGSPLTSPGTWALAAGALVLTYKTRLHILWMLAAGALAGVLGWA
jgi:chromate transporter